MYNVISFYRYTKLEQPAELVESLKTYCHDNNILGRIFVGLEGINGAASGKNDVMEQFKLFLQSFFPNLTFREQSYPKHSYHKLIVRERDEICVFQESTDVKNTGNHLKPEELKQLYDSGDDFTIIDARNDYEFDVGHFKDAVRLPIKVFSEFAGQTTQFEHLKEKKIVLYCTGGVRCEKASAYMKEHGFKDVNQVDGGIINYINTVGDDKWQGGLFVFDDRLISEQPGSITKCIHCSKETQKMIDCHNLVCDKLAVVCEDCQTKFHKTCSIDCRDAPNHRKEKVSYTKVGTVLNYYTDLHVALVKLDHPLKIGDTITIKGKTTNLKLTLNEFKEHANNEITFLINDTVRENDSILV